MVYHLAELLIYFIFCQFQSKVIKFDKTVYFISLLILNKKRDKWLSNVLKIYEI